MPKATSSSTHCTSRHGVVSSKEASSLVTSTAACEWTEAASAQAKLSLSDRIGRKWVLAWLTVLLATVR